MFRRNKEKERKTEIIEHIKELKKSVRIAVELEDDVQYMAGYYNGLEYALALLENREKEELQYLDVVKNKEVEHTEQNRSNRTVAGNCVVKQNKA